MKLECNAKNFSRPGGPVVSSSPRDREERLVNAWGRDLYEDLLRLNQLDLELFRRAQKEIERRIALVPQFEWRLAEFRMRCSRLQAGASHAGATALRTARGTRS